ncbi:hypothetical protein AMTRI_Chr01g111200 [Amborella trichopoda]
MHSFPRLLVFNYLSLLQTAAQLLSAAMIIYALNTAMPVPSATPLLLQPWFIVLVLAGTIKRLTGLATGIAFERDWVVLVIEVFPVNVCFLRELIFFSVLNFVMPIALAQANTMLSQIDLLCEITSITPLSLSNGYDPKGPWFSIVVGLQDTFLCFLSAELTDSRGEYSIAKFACTCGKLCRPREFLAAGNLGETAGQRVMDSIKHGWFEYRQQPVLPANLAYVLLYFNVVGSGSKKKPLLFFLCLILANPSLTQWFMVHFSVKPLLFLFSMLIFACNGSFLKIFASSMCAFVTGESLH